MTFKDLTDEQIMAAIIDGVMNTWGADIGKARAGRLLFGAGMKLTAEVEGELQTWLTTGQVALAKVNEIRASWRDPANDPSPSGPSQP